MFSAADSAKDVYLQGVILLQQYHHKKHMYAWSPVLFPPCFRQSFTPRVATCILPRLLLCAAVEQGVCSVVEVCDVSEVGVASSSRSLERRVSVQGFTIPERGLEISDAVYAKFMLGG